MNTTKIDLVEPETASEAASPRCEATRELNDVLAFEILSRQERGPVLDAGSIGSCLEFIDWQRGKLAQVTAKRDELLSALKDLRTRVVATGPNCLNTTKADEAISKAEQH